MPQKNRTNLYIGPDQLVALRKLKENTGIPISASVRIALREYLKKRAKDLK